MVNQIFKIMFLEWKLNVIIFPNQTIGYDPLVPADEAAKYNIEWMELDKLWSKADYITVHTPLIPQTKGR